MHFIILDAKLKGFKQKPPLLFPVPFLHMFDLTILF